ncbi:hypothetical protein NHQ30_005864 [Ciborinia camelliae]|nr:hypothetical protein NHQ30_005864 [Ciborinia camelliae]
MVRADPSNMSPRQLPSAASPSGPSSTPGTDARGIISESGRRDGDIEACEQRAGISGSRERHGGGQSRRVCDVKWGGGFPRANRAASAYLVEELVWDWDARNLGVRRVGELVPMMMYGLDREVAPSGSMDRTRTRSTIPINSSKPDGLKTVVSGSTAQLSVEKEKKNSNRTIEPTTTSPRAPKTIPRIPPSPAGTFRPYQTFTAASIIFKLGVQHDPALQNHQPARARHDPRASLSGALGNNETHDPCMLVATHPNAAIWDDCGFVSASVNCWQDSGILPSQAKCDPLIQRPERSLKWASNRESMVRKSIPNEDPPVLKI